MRTAVVYTFPFETTAALRAVAELEQMGDLDALEAALRQAQDGTVQADNPASGEKGGATEESTAAARQDALERINELRQRREELIAALPPVRQVRLLVRAVKFNDQTHYRLLYKEGMEWFKEQTGAEIDADLGGDPEKVDLRNLAVFRAEMLCAIDRRHENGQTLYMGEERTFHYGAEPLNGWQPWTLPSEWVNLDTMGDSLPMEMLNEWLAATRELNAGVLSSIPFFLRQRRASRNVIA